MKKINIETFDKNFYFFSERPEAINPDAFALFQFYDTYFFQNVLEACEVKWSKRMTLCAGTCKHSSHNSCTITLSESLLQFRNSNELKETLLHEMIHAFLFLTNPKACLEDGGHGKEFQSLMNFINGVTGLKITVYHSFIDEVELFRKHVWKCNGPCVKDPPFYGIVKRQMNRPPQKSDPWFEDHKKKCGGEFIKIDGPEFGEDGQLKQQTKEVNKKTKKVQSQNSQNSQLKNVNVPQKQGKGQNNPKQDKLQTLMDKFIIASPSQNEQKNITKIDQQKQQTKSQEDEDLEKAILLSLQDNNSNMQSFNHFMYQGQQNNENIRHNFTEQKNINNNNQMKNQNNNQNMNKQRSQQIKYYKNIKDFIDSLDSDDSETIEYQNNQHTKEKGDIQTKNVQLNDKNTQLLGQRNLNKQVEQKYQKQEVFQISKENQNKKQEQDSPQQLSNNNQQLLQQESKIQMEQEKPQEIVCQVKIQIGFTRDPLKNKQEYYIYLMNAKMNILDILKLLYEIFEFEESKYQFKHLISECNGRDEKIENYPQYCLQQLNEMFILLFDFGNLKIYMKELKRFVIEQQHLNISETFQKAIQQPQKQQHVQINNK